MPTLLVVFYNIYIHIFNDLVLMKLFVIIIPIRSFRLEFATGLRPDDWVFDPAVSGGGVLMEGTTHWVRPLRMW